MIENYDISKENNLRKMVAEYEQERQILAENRAKYEQHRRDCMKDAALMELDEIDEKELDYKEGLAFFARIGHSYYAPHFQDLITGYTNHVYANAWANLVRKYATVYDKDNLKKYPKASPLPKMRYIMNKNMPIWMTYERLKALAAYCPFYRQK